MINETPLLTINTRIKRPDPAKIAALKGAQTSHIVDSMDGRGALDWTIKPLDPANAKFCGPAITARAWPADNLAVYGAIEQAQKGDVIMVASDGYKATAVVGDLVVGTMRNKGVAALVLDGMARDRAGIIATGIPVFAAGITPNSPAKTGPGTVNLPITIAGVPVSPGDVIVGDEDGVVVIPLAQLDAVLASLKLVLAAEAKAEAVVKGGSIMSEAAGKILASDRIKRL